MAYAGRLLVFAAISVAGHLLLAHGATWLPVRALPKRPVIIQVQLREAAPPVPEPPSPKPPRPEPKPVPEPRRQPVHQAPARAAAPAPPAPRAEVPRNTPPTERPAQTADSTLNPAFGLSMESTSTGGSGPAMPTGNTLQGKPDKKAAAPGKVKPLAAPAQAYEVTRMPLPKRRCVGVDTEEARQAGIEGTVILDLVVGEDGRVREVTVVQGLSHGLTEAAVKAAKECPFTPGERDGKPVPVKIRGFKIRFFASGGD
jgi:protein TonB